MAGTVQWKWWGGDLAFFLFLYFAVGSPGVRLPVVGFSFFYKLIFFGRFAVFSCGFVFYELLSFLNLLQVVQAE